MKAKPIELRRLANERKREMPLFNMVSDYIVVIQMCTIIWKFKKKPNTHLHYEFTNPFSVAVGWFTLVKKKLLTITVHFFI